MINRYSVIPTNSDHQIAHVNSRKLDALAWISAVRRNGDRRTFYLNDNERGECIGLYRACHGHDSDGRNCLKTATEYGPGTLTYCADHFRSFLKGY